MKLIVDSGSTSTQWVFIKPNGETIEFISQGFNPYYFKGEKYLDELVDSMSEKIVFSQVENIFFYGSGCSTKTNCAIVKTSLWEMFSEANIFLKHDLYGAAIALCGNSKGIACILGTGSNSCLWDGKEIIENVPSLGYLLADEGSGVHLGKLIVKEILLGNAPTEIIDIFYSVYKTNFEGVLNRLYKMDNPNKFLSEISKFAGEYQNDKWIQNQIIRNFDMFIENQVSKYTDYTNYKINFVGSLASEFKTLLSITLEEKGLDLGKVYKSPMEGLIDFHSK